MFKYALLPSLCPSLKVGLAGLLHKEVKQYSVLYNKEMKEYREKDVMSNAEAKDIELIENSKSNFTLFFMLHHGVQLY